MLISLKLNVYFSYYIFLSHLNFFW